MKFLPDIVPVDDATRVAEVRRLAMAQAEAEGLNTQVINEVAIIASEIATNLLKHAKSGEVHLSRLSAEGEAGIQFLAIDRGPGMANLHACAADGYSTSGTAGTGLGAIARLSDVFDVYTQTGRGTVLMARKYQSARELHRHEQWTFGAVMAPYPGEKACGDAWTLRQVDGSIAVIVADGLGHGVLASEASAAALIAFRKTAPQVPATILENVHMALRATRGAAVAVMTIDQTAGRVNYAGLGNISGVLLGGPRIQSMLSHNGTAGLQGRRIQEFTYTLPPEAAVIMHSDGLNTSWSLDPYPGLLRRHPAVVAGVLYRDASRGRDDVCVVVGRRMVE